MKRLLTAILACIALFITLGASAEGAEASYSGAERAVERTIERDFMLDLSSYASCDPAGRSRYNCTWSAYEGPGDNFQGRARVIQRGSRYSVSYRVTSW